MRTFVVLAMVLCLAVPLAYGEEKDDWYGQADFSIGVLQDLKTGEQEPYWSFPLGGFRVAEFRGGFVVDIADIGVGPTAAVLAMVFHLGNAQDWGLDAGWAKFVSVSVGPYMRYGFVSEALTGGITASFLEFSFGGGVEEQRNR